MVKPFPRTSAHEPAFTQRFEAKYLVSELLAEAAKDYIGPYVRPDAHGAAYSVTSLYFDSPSLHTFWSSERGESNRFKLRIRAYSDAEDAPVFFEIKRRINRIIQKDRALVRRPSVASLLDGGFADRQVLAEPGDTQDIENLHRFRALAESLGAAPRVTVRYDREAYVSDLEEPVRITFDRQVRCLASPVYRPDLWSNTERWFEVNAVPVLLEVKFTNRFPLWVSHLIKRLNLRRGSFAKYVACVKAVQRAGIPVGGNKERAAPWNS
jgi:hypothetical protein